MGNTITVNVGEILECGADDEIRTRGADPCVALIVISKNADGKIEKKCAHFCVGVAKKPTQASVESALNPILAKEFTLDGIQAVGFTYGGGGGAGESKCICTRLRQHFVRQNVEVDSFQNDSLTTNGLKIEAKNMQNWPWTNDPATNSKAELKW